MLPESPSNNDDLVEVRDGVFLGVSLSSPFLVTFDHLLALHDLLRILVAIVLGLSHWDPDSDLIILCNFSFLCFLGILAKVCAITSHYFLCFLFLVHIRKVFFSIHELTMTLQ